MVDIVLVRAHYSQSDGQLKVESARVMACYIYDEHDCLTLTGMLCAKIFTQRFGVGLYNS